MNTILSLLLSLFLLSESYLYAEISAEEREAVFFSEKVTSTTGEPSTLKYYQYSQNLPDEISVDVFTERDFSELVGKKIFVGYGTVDPKGEDCKIFTPDVTGMENNITVCLPWWRVERDYMITTTQGEQGDSFLSFLSRMQRPRPPKNVSVCDAWDASQVLPSGTVTCTTYYDKSISDECYANPLQPQCRKDNCGNWVKENCTRKGRSIGHNKETLENVKKVNSSTESRYESKVQVVTEQFECPGGSYTETAVCTDEKEMQMNPYECKPDDTSTPLDDSIMIYCDESRPVRTVQGGTITGFLGMCPAEASASNSPFEVTCLVDSFSQTRNECTNYGPSITSTTSSVLEENYNLDYTIETVDVLSGAVDRFSNREDCIRANTVDDGRESEITIKIDASGNLDDDFYAIVHKVDSSHSVIYCNQQHNDDAGSKLYRPELSDTPIQCIQNGGTYDFSQEIAINKGDLVSIQQANENENEGDSPFAIWSEFGSSEVVIDNIQAIPVTSPQEFPYLATCCGTWLKGWSAILSSMAILFPYSGVYTLFFYNNDGDLVARKDIGLDDFEALNESGGFEQIFLAEIMPISDSLDDSNVSGLCLRDNWTEYGGGVRGGKDTINGTPCQNPQLNTTTQRERAVYKIIVKDQLTGVFTTIPLVYPLGYPNRLFISKVKTYENRIYNCYQEPEIAVPLSN